MEGTLPVRDPVANYEKIKRIGEGTYGVVCEFLLVLSCTIHLCKIGEHPSHYSWYLQTKPEIGPLGRSWLLRKSAWSESEMVAIMHQLPLTLSCRKASVQYNI
jgi:hypothetical protein